MKYIVDLTSAREHTEASTLQRLAGILQPADEVICLIRPEQKIPTIPGSIHRVEKIADDVSKDESRFLDTVIRMVEAELDADADADNKVTLASYLPKLRAAFRDRPGKDARASYLSLGSLATSGGTQAITQLPRTADGRTKTDFFRGHMRNSLHGGPFEMVREAIYDEIQAIAFSDARLSANQIVHESVKAVRQDHATPAGKKGLPWERVRSFMKALLWEEPVLMSSGNLVRPEAGFEKPIVDHLDPDFRDKLDARIILFLLDTGVHVYLTDVPSLATLLFNSPKDENHPRVERLLESLWKAGKITIDPQTEQISRTPGRYDPHGAHALQVEEAGETSGG